MKRKIYLFLVLILVLFLVGCGSGATSSPDVNGSISNEGEYTENGILTETSRKIYYNVNISIECEDVSEKFNYYINKAVSFDGYMSNSRLDPSSNATVTLRIPTSKLNDFLNFIDDDESKILDKDITSNDITTKYNQYEARLEVLKASRASYIKILEKASTINDVISINRRIEEIDSEILQLENQLSYYDNLVDYSTVVIHLTSNHKEGFFKGYLNYLVVVVKVIFYIVVYTLPYGLIVLLVFMTIYVIKKIKKNRKNER